MLECVCLPLSFHSSHRRSPTDTRVCLETHWFLCINWTAWPCPLHPCQLLLLSLHPFSVNFLGSSGAFPTPPQVATYSSRPWVEVTFSFPGFPICDTELTARVFLLGERLILSPERVVIGVKESEGASSSCQLVSHPIPSSRSDPVRCWHLPGTLAAWFPGCSPATEISL